MSITPVPTSSVVVFAAMAAISGNGVEIELPKWCTRIQAPSNPDSSAATARSTIWRTASAPVGTGELLEPPEWPKVRNPIFFTFHLLCMQNYVLWVQLIPGQYYSRT